MGSRNNPAVMKRCYWVEPVRVAQVKVYRADPATTNFVGPYSWDCELTKTQGIPFANRNCESRSQYFATIGLGLLIGSDLLPIF